MLRLESTRSLKLIV